VEVSIVFFDNFSMVSEARDAQVTCAKKRSEYEQFLKTKT